MKVLLYGKNGIYPSEIEAEVKASGLEIVKDNPEAVITFGGDGTFIGAERDFPGIPKFPLRNSKVCHICSPLSNDVLIQKIAASKVKPKTFIKLSTEFGGQTFTALNEISLRNKIQNITLRFTISAIPNGTGIPTEELIGDGVIISTPFGSTGYYYSAARNFFSEGIGIAFNNIHNLTPTPIVLPETSAIKVTINRGPALLAVDNNPNIVELPEGQSILIKKSPSAATLLEPLP